MLSVLAALFVLGVAVFVHELGHFIVARLCGVRVDVFSIGFGTRLFGFRRGTTDYRVSLLPLGGYVKLAGEFPEEGAVPGTDDLFGRPAWQRILVFAGGGGGNFVFAWLCFAGLLWYGYPEAVWPTTVGVVSDSSAAAVAGLRVGDDIRAIDGQPVREWADIPLLLTSTAAPAALLTVQRDTQTLTLPVVLPENIEEHPGIIGIWPQFSTVVGAVSDSYPAALAGLRAGDRILAVGDTPVAAWTELQQAIRSTGRQPVRIIYERDSVACTTVLTPRYHPQQRATMIGIALYTDTTIRRFTFPACLWQGARKVGEVSVQMVASLYKLVTGQLSIKAMGGPVMIFAGAAAVAEVGWIELLLFTCFISISLGIMNLAPLPITDGGHIMFTVLEKLRGRRLSGTVNEWIQIAGVTFLLALFAVVLYNDAERFGLWYWLTETVVRNF